MKTTFKKTLLAASLAAVAGVSQAATVAITGVNVSQEGSKGAASVAVPNVVVTLGAEYTTNDTVTLTITGAEFDAALSTPSASVALAGTDTATYGLLSKSATSVTFRITDVADNDGGGVAFTGRDLTITGLVMKTDTVIDATGDISIAYSAKTNSNLDIDNTGTLSDVAATVVAQFSSSVTKSLNAVIDVEKSRQQFTAGDDSTTTDVMTVTIAEAAAAVNDAVYSKATHTIKGDFSWMNTNATAGVDAGELTAAFGVTGAGDDTFTQSINAAMDTITVVATDAGADAVEAHTFTFTNAGEGTGNAVLNAQSFTVSTVVEWDAPVAAAGSKTTATDAAAGSWTLNGSVVRVPYLVMKDGRFGSIINVTNHGSKSGAIVVDIFDENGTKLQSNYAAGTSNAGSVTSIANAVRNGLVAAGKDVVNSTIKYSVQITTNVPADDISVYAAYTDSQNGGERAIVNNDSKVQTK